MTRFKTTSVLLSILFFCLSFARAVKGGESPGPTAAEAAQTHAQAQPDIEKYRADAKQESDKTLDKEAIAAIAETRKAVSAIAEGKQDEAMAAIERATGKVSILVARNPTTALIPVEVSVQIIDAAPYDIQSIKRLGKAADKAVDDKDYPGARVILTSLTSELRVRTYQLPLATYPTALQSAARLLQEKKSGEAGAVLETALHTLVLIDRITPLPMVIAGVAINDAQTQREKDKGASQRLLAVARYELDRAKELGYAGRDPEYTTLNSEISNLEKQLSGNENSESAFARLKERVAGFFKRHFGSERKSEVATN